MRNFLGILTAVALGMVLLLAYQRLRPEPRESASEIGAAFFETQGDGFREFNTEAAAGAYQSALALSDDAQTPKERGALLAKYGYVLYELGENERAKSAFKEAKRWGHEDAWSTFTENAIARVDMAGPYPRFLEPDAPRSASLVKPKPAARAQVDVAPKKVEAPPPKPAFNDEVDERPDDPDEEEAPTEIAASIPRGDCTLQLPRRWERGTYLVGATVNEIDTTLILDTGATFTVLSRTLVEEAGIEINSGSSITARTAAGIRRFETGYADSFWVGGRELTNLRVTICEECAAEQSAGLLGLDVQRALGMSLDVVNDVIRFADCE